MPIECPHCEQSSDQHDLPCCDGEEVERDCPLCGESFIVIAVVTIEYDVEK